MAAPNLDLDLDLGEDFGAWLSFDQNLASETSQSEPAVDTAKQQQQKQKHDQFQPLTAPARRNILQPAQYISPPVISSSKKLHISQPPVVDNILHISPPVIDKNLHPISSPRVMQKTVSISPPVMQKSLPISPPVIHKNLPPTVTANTQQFRVSTSPYIVQSQLPTQNSPVNLPSTPRNDSLRLPTASSPAKSSSSIPFNSPRHASPPRSSSAVSPHSSPSVAQRISKPNSPLRSGTETETDVSPIKSAASLRPGHRHRQIIMDNGIDLTQLKPLVVVAKKASGNSDDQSSMNGTVTGSAAKRRAKARAERLGLRLANAEVVKISRPATSTMAAMNEVKETIASPVDEHQPTARVESGVFSPISFEFLNSDGNLFAQHNGMDHTRPRSRASKKSKSSRRSKKSEKILPALPLPVSDLAGFEFGSDADTEGVYSSFQNARGRMSSDNISHKSRKFTKRRHTPRDSAAALNHQFTKLDLGSTLGLNFDVNLNFLDDSFSTTASTVGLLRQQDIQQQTKFRRHILTPPLTNSPPPHDFLGLPSSFLSSPPHTPNMDAHSLNKILPISPHDGSEEIIQSDRRSRQSHISRPGTADRIREEMRAIRNKEFSNDTRSKLRSSAIPNESVFLPTDTDDSGSVHFMPRPLGLGVTNSDPNARRRSKTDRFRLKSLFKNGPPITIPKSRNFFNNSNQNSASEDEGFSTDASANRKIKSRKMSFKAMGRRLSSSLSTLMQNANEYANSASRRRESISDAAGERIHAETLHDAKKTKRRRFSFTEGLENVKRGGRRLSESLRSVATAVVDVARRTVENSRENSLEYQDIQLRHLDQVPAQALGVEPDEWTSFQTRLQEKNLSRQKKLKHGQTLHVCPTCCYNIVVKPEESFSNCRKCAFILDTNPLIVPKNNPMTLERAKKLLESPFPDYSIDTSGQSSEEDTGLNSLSKAQKFTLEALQSTDRYKTDKKRFSNHTKIHNLKNYPALIEGSLEMLTSHRAMCYSFLTGEPLSIESSGSSTSDIIRFMAMLQEASAACTGAELKLLRAVEATLKRPGLPMTNVECCRFFPLVLELPFMFQPEINPNSHVSRAVLSRLLGMLSNVPNEFHHYFVSWFAKEPAARLRRLVDGILNFVSYRIRKTVFDSNGQAIRPNLAYHEDWRIRASARVLALLYAANAMSEVLAPQEFYATVLDGFPMMTDYLVWQTQPSSVFSFCQYPFLISIGTKKKILEFDAQKQMFAQKKPNVAEMYDDQPPTTTLRIRREYLVPDSISQIGACKPGDLKKSLRIEFEGEPGIDAGGVRKEWFLLLTRKLFDASWGMMVYDDETKLGYLNPTSYEASSEFQLLGTVIGLAIYNDCLLELNLPLALYRKLIDFPVGLEDLAQFRPTIANSLRQLLSYDGNNFINVFHLTFVGHIEAFGQISEVPLVENGANIFVTRDNRQEYVQRYVAFLLSDGIKRQFDAFRHGFLTVCGGSALSLFKAEELELMVHGSPEPLNIADLQQITEYDGFTPLDVTVVNFWAYMATLSPATQRRLLAFTTGSDRLPAAGVSKMVFRIQRAGEDCERLPTAKTCFNRLCLYDYQSKKKLARKLDAAIKMSEGFMLV